MSTMTNVTATATIWIEAPRGASAAVVLQNQGYGELSVAIGANAPASLDAPAYILDRLEESTFRDFSAGDKLWVRSRSDSIKVLIWSA